MSLPILDLGFAAYRRSLAARRGKPSGEAAAQRSLDAIRTGLGLPPELPSNVQSFAARQAAVGSYRVEMV